VNVALVEDGKTATNTGTVSSVVLLDTATERPAAGAETFIVRVHALLAPEIRDWGEHVRPITVGVLIKLIEALAAPPLTMAVTVAELLLGTVPAEAGKLAVLLPAATVTEVGVVKSVLLSERATTAPPVGAALFSVTVQLLTPPDVSVAGLQVNPVGTVVARSPSE
jgi:hypothetical protein